MNYLSSLKTPLSPEPRNTLEYIKVKKINICWINEWVRCYRPFFPFQRQSMKYDEEKNELFFKLVWHSEKLQYINLTKVSPFLHKICNLIFFWNASYLYFQMGSWHSLVIVICPEVGIQTKLTQPDKQEDLTFPKSKGDNHLICLPLSLAGHKWKHVSPSHWQFCNGMGNLPLSSQHSARQGGEMVSLCSRS